MSGKVFVLSSSSVEPISEHVRERNIKIASQLAELKRYHYQGEYLASTANEPSYFVPHKTLVGLTAAEAVGIKTTQDLFGGVVAHNYQATKAITHGLINPQAAKPSGWSNTFAAQVQVAVLPGYTAFCQADALLAGSLLLEQGAVRVKRTLAASGRGQVMVQNREELALTLQQIPAAELEIFGVVLEKNLWQVTTLAVGQVQVDELTISYYGTQRTSINNLGNPEYGGADLTIVRGGFEALLLQAAGRPAIELAIAQARLYDAATSHYDLIVSRRSYDVGQGYDKAGHFYSGVLEQSWRIGGASSSEVAALQIFKNNPTATVVEASSYQIYGTVNPIPASANIFYNGIDPEFGAMQIYQIVHEVKFVDSSGEAASMFNYKLVTN
jgi:hypothetical protein